MAAIEKTAGIMIKRPLVEVFNFVTDPGNFPLWQPFVIEAAITSKGPMAVGATYRYKFKAMDNEIETHGVITAYRAFSEYAYEATSGPFPIKGGFKFQEVDGFVEVTVYGEAEPSGYFSMAGPLIGMLLGRQLRTTLQNLKEILESRNS